MALIHGGIILIRYGWHTNCTDQLRQPQYIYVYHIDAISTAESTETKAKEKKSVNLDC